MGKTLKNKDETMTIRVKRETKERVVALYEKTETTATLASFLGDMVLLGLRIKEATFDHEKTVFDKIEEEAINRQWNEKTARLINAVRRHKNNGMWGEHLQKASFGNKGEEVYNKIVDAAMAEGIDLEEVLKETEKTDIKKGA